MLDELIDQVILIIVLDSRVLNAPAQMISNDLRLERPNPTDGTGNGDDLTENLYTVSVIFNHSSSWSVRKNHFFSVVSG
jgi:hypothetical protein